eukprot:1160575-Pelagomonas_calceolata.AAC.1
MQRTSPCSRATISTSPFPEPLDTSILLNSKRAESYRETYAIQEFCNQGSLSSALYVGHFTTVASDGNWCPNLHWIIQGRLLVSEGAGDAAFKRHGKGHIHFKFTHQSHFCSCVEKIVVCLAPCLIYFGIMPQRGCHNRQKLYLFVRASGSYPGGCIGSCYWDGVPAQPVHLPRRYARSLLWVCTRGKEKGTTWTVRTLPTSIQETWSQRLLSLPHQCVCYLYVTRSFNQEKSKSKIKNIYGGRGNPPYNI